MVEFTIGNSGSKIAAVDLPHVFEAFVSKNKPGGTGLGLAIASKIVNDHGGRISAASSERGVEFRFTMPAGLKVVEAAVSASLPRSSRDASSLLSRPTDPSRGRDTSQLEAAVLKQLEQAPRKPAILLVDDEAAYRRLLIAHLQESPALRDAFTICEAPDGRAALEQATVHSPEIVFLDIDLGVDSPNGFDLVPLLREVTPKVFICMHSNRTRSADYRQTVESDANSYCLKPMSRSHMLKLLLMALANTQAGHSRSPSASEGG
jgi:CheY-like chemotaxis protein